MFCVKTYSTLQTAMISAQRCLGHCLANHGYALVYLEDVDEAQVMFQKVQEQAEYSGE